MADGGSINLRLSLKGAEQVRAELDKIGPAGAKMGRELDRAMRQPGPGLRALDAGAVQVRDNLDGLTGRLGPLGAGLAAIGPWGLAAAAGLAAMAAAAAVAIGQARAASAFADQIEDSAQKLNIGTTALQEYRFALQEVGGTAEDADAAIDGFQKKLGEGIAGGRSVKWFERLGFSQEDLRAFGSTEAALDAVIRKISELDRESERAAIAEKLGLGSMTPLIREGADAIDEMRARAQELGIVMDQEMVRRGAEVNRQMEVMSQVIDLQLKQAFIDLGPVLVDVMGLVADLANALGRLADRWKDVEQRTDRGLAAQSNALQQQLIDAAAPAEGRLTPGERMRRSPWWIAQTRANLAEVNAEIARRARTRIAEDQARSPTVETELSDVSSGGGGGGGGASAAEREAERRRQAAEREIERLDRDEISAQREWVQAVIGRADTAASREEVARQLRELDDREFDARMTEVENTIRLGGLTAEQVEQAQARIDALRDLRTDVQAAEAAEAAERAAEERREALKAAEDEHLRITTDILSLASSSARTSEERQAIELQLLELAQRRQTADLQAAIEAEKEPEARARLVAALERLPTLYAAQADEVRRRTAGPLGQWRDAQLQTAGEASEWLQQETLDALDSVNGGLIDAWRNAESAGDAFARMGDVAVNALNRVVDALLEVAIQKMLIQPLTEGLFGGGQGGGSGGFLGNLIGNITGALFGRVGEAGAASTTPAVTPGMLGRVMQRPHARGGVVGSAGWTPVGELGMEIVDLPVGSRVYDADRTQRTLLDFDARMRAMGAATGAQRAPVINMPIQVVNRTSEAVTARTQRLPDGGVEMILEPAVRSAVARMGADGSLAQAHGLTPRPIRRGR